MGYQSARQGQLLWGTVLIVVGVLFLLDSMNILSFGDSWPLILVAIGAKMIFFPSPKSQETVTPEGITPETPPPEWQHVADAATSSDYISENRFLGDLNVIVQSNDFKGGSASAFIGDLKIDISRIAISAGTKTLVVSGFIGDADIRMPSNLPYKIHANAAIGDFRIFGARDDGFALNKVYRSPDYESAPARLNLRVSFFIGDIKIKY